jgi:hypothetical protein
MGKHDEDRPLFNTRGNGAGHYPRRSARLTHDPRIAAAEAALKRGDVARAGAVDRILSSHPEVVSAGELQAMPLAVKEAAANSSRVVVDAATIHALLGADPRMLRERYMARAMPHGPAEKLRFVDKLPANIL